MSKRMNSGRVKANAINANGNNENEKKKTMFVSRRQAVPGNWNE